MTNIHGNNITPNFIFTIIILFFLMSKKEVHSKGYLMKTEAEQKIQRKKQTEERKENKKTNRKQQRTNYKGERKGTKGENH